MLIPVEAVVFLAGVLMAELREGWVRLLGTVLMLAMAATALASIAGSQAAVWAIGPVIASALLVSKPAPRLPFERLILRTAVTAGLMLAGAYVALRLPSGETPWALFAMPWVVAGLGLAWVSLPRDRVEARRGAVLAIAGGGALLLTSFPSGLAGAGLTGALALAPLLGESTMVTGAPRVRSMLPSIILGVVAVVCTAAALLDGHPATISGAGLAVALDGSVFTGAALLIAIAAIASEATIAAAAVLATVSLFSASPSVHWAALAGAVAILVWEAQVARLLWSGLVLLGLAAVLSGLISGPPGSRWQAAALAVGWLLLILSRIDRWVAAILLAASTFYVVGAVHHLAPSSVSRFQWIAAAGVMLAILHGVFGRPVDAAAQAPWRLRTVMSSALIVIGVATANPLGTLGAVLLLLDLAVVQASAPSGPPAFGAAAQAGLLARSGWPPSAAFAGRVLTLLAAVSTSVVLAAPAVVLIVGLQLVPLWDARPPARPIRQARITDWAATAISLGAGIAPALVLRMLQGH